MTERKSTARTVEKSQPGRAERRTRRSSQDRQGPPQPELSPQERQERKERVLTQGKPAMVSSIAEAVILKGENIFFLTEPDGCVPLEGDHGFGLYCHDCRFLNGYEMRLAGKSPSTLVSTAEYGYMATFQLTNPDIHMENGRLIPKEEIGIVWERSIDSETLTLNDLIKFQNFGLEPAEFPVSLTFQAGFEDIFTVRELLEEHLGKSHPPEWKEGALSFLYEGSDGLYRYLEIHFSPSPGRMEGTTAHFSVTLQPREHQEIRVLLRLAESSDRAQLEREVDRQPDIQKAKDCLQGASNEWLSKHTSVRSDSLLLNSILRRSLLDLRILRSSIESQEFFAAGIPWFATLFGRDSLITALQTLAYQSHIAEQTLRVLAGYQGKEVNRWRDEQPGKILHELRIGELARAGEIPHTPYYGTVDATPLFLILIGRHAAWTGDLTLFHDLREKIERALEWIAHYGDQNGDGYIEYKSTSEKGLINQGWKDSGDAIVNQDGSLATPPISLVEAQGYVYMAKLAMAELYHRTGETDRAEQLRREAEALCARFNRDFWLEDQGIYALALQADGRPAAVVSSNPGHLLWSGIADPDKARRTMERLMAEDMFSGWGIRTLSEKERRYNPIGYHLGTVWPHDNAIIAAGFRRYGFDEAALHLFQGIVEAAMDFQHRRLPELFAGFRREEYGVPVRYPVACRIQAWAAGSVPHLVETLLGLVPEAFDHRLRIVRPMLPHLTSHIELHRLRVGGASADLRFERASTGVAVQVLRIDGPLDVVVEH